MKKSTSQGGNTELICLMALLMSLVALTIDAVLPALGEMGDSLGVKNPNDNQLVIYTFFFGLSIGQMFYGPLSDSYGRKKPVYLGISILILGSLFSILATNFTFLLIGRACQGFGAATCRIIPMAMIRDKLEGREMARVMSLILVIFIMVPALAPSIGQVILFVAGWRSIFGFILIIGVFAMLWFVIRQPETLPIERRQAFSVATIISGVIETCKNPIARYYTIASGMIYGAFLGYLSSAQQILQVQYDLGKAFSLYFGGLAIAIGLSSFVTSKLVMRFGMEKLSFLSLLMLSIFSCVFYLYSRNFLGHPNLHIFLTYMAVTFFSFGVLFGTFNSMALQPMGHIAGVATSVISFVQMLLSVAVGGAIGQSYNGTVLPLVLGFFLCGFFPMIIMIYVRKCVAGRPMPTVAVSKR